MATDLPENHKTEYFKHNRDIFVPKDLQVGDIISCKIASSREGPSGHYIRYLDRRAIVLGFQANLMQTTYTGIHVARLASSRNALHKESSFHIDKSMGEKGDISGILFPSVIRTNRTDVVPLNETHFPSGKIERIGRISPGLLSQFSEAFRKDQENGLSSESSYRALDSRQTYIPGFSYVLEMRQDAENLWPEIVRPYSQLDDFIKARIASEMQNDSRIVGSHMNIDEVIADHREKRKELQNLWKNQTPAVRAAFIDVTTVPEVKNAELPAHEAFQTNPRKNKAKKKRSLPFPLPPVIRNEPSEPEIFPTKRRTYVVANDTSYENITSLTEHFRSGTNVSRIILPEALWRGRYINMKIFNLTDHQNSDLAFRPCAVWKVFHDRETGDLAGMELHPVTRRQAYKFSYKMPVYPQYTMSRAPSQLIADCVIRVPLDARYFHEITTANFFELTPNMVEEFAVLREIVILSEDRVHVYGLQTIPDNWVETNLPDTPSYEQFKKWADQREISFDGGTLTRNIRTRTAGKHERHP